MTCFLSPIVAVVPKHFEHFAFPSVGHRIARLHNAVNYFGQTPTAQKVAPVAIRRAQQRCFDEIGGAQKRLSRTRQTRRGRGQTELKIRE